MLAVSAIAQHDNLSNLSAEWVRTPARNAATDANDIIVYNPAGLVRLNNGFHINLGNQSLFRWLPTGRRSSHDGSAAL